MTLSPVWSGTVTGALSMMAQWGETLVDAKETERVMAKRRLELVADFTLLEATEETRKLDSQHHLLICASAKNIPAIGS